MIFVEGDPTFEEFLEMASNAYAMEVDDALCYGRFEDDEEVLAENPDVAILYAYDDTYRFNKTFNTIVAKTDSTYMLFDEDENEVEIRLLFLK